MPQYFEETTPGAWHPFSVTDAVNTFDKHLGKVFFRKVGEGTVEARLETPADMLNVHGFYHGGALAGLVERLLLLPLYVERSIYRGGMVVVGMDLQFVSNCEITSELYADLERTHETGKMGFVSGKLRHGDQTLVVFQSTVRKLPPPKE